MGRGAGSRSTTAHSPAPGERCRMYGWISTDRFSNSNYGHTSTQMANAAERTRRGCQRGSVEWLLINVARETLMTMRSKHCSRCKRGVRADGQRYCRRCHAAANRRSRKINRDRQFEKERQKLYRFNEFLEANGFMPPYKKHPTLVERFLDLERGKK